MIHGFECSSQANYLYGSCTELAQTSTLQLSPFYSTAMLARDQQSSSPAPLVDTNQGMLFKGSGGRNAIGPCLLMRFLPPPRFGSERTG